MTLTPAVGTQLLASPSRDPTDYICLHRGEVRCCETNLKHNTQKKTSFSYNEM